MLTTDQLRPILENKYNRNDWYKILRQNFNAHTLRESPVSIPSISGNEFDAIAYELGEFDTTDGFKVGIYEVDVPGVKQIYNNKVGLRNLLKNVYTTTVDAALIVFTQGDKWRFSYVSEVTALNKETGLRESIKTDSKRYTYLFGKDERVKTAADRFTRIQQESPGFGKGTTLQALRDTFSVEKMSKEFFNEYRKHYGAFLAFLIGENEDGKLVGDASSLFKTIFDSDHKKARNFVKKMLGRIVFLYFLEKKGWLGVPEDQKWGKGDPDFLRNLFIDCQDQESFYPLVLEPLFHYTLNDERVGDFFAVQESIFKKSGYSKLKIPFLNGGLFEPESYKTDFLVFPSLLFKSLFSFFDRYNFTVHEDSPGEHTVAVDPEMLGHIFENLLEDNKDKGAFYTPKEIVHYMCQESLVEYLYSKCRTDFDETLRQGIERFIKKQELNGIANYEERILVLLRDVKICDPAIGSGAFPMGILLEIFHAVETLNYANESIVGKIWELRAGWRPAHIKLKIIQNSIYGVDVEPGAVDIARLRFWLSLVVDEENPQPLPNLDYKIMQGNSLLERFYSIELDRFGNGQSDIGIYEPETDLFGRIKESQIKITFAQSDTLKTVQSIVKKYFNEKVPSNKLKHQKNINELVTSHIDYNINLKIVQLQRLISEIAQQNTTNKSGVKKLKEWKEELAKQDDTKDELHKIQNSNIKPYFLWHLFFKDIFDEGGFDIVIGNPPYIQLQSIKEQADLLQAAGYKTFARTGDIYALFYEKGISLLKAGGVLTYITSNKWMRAAYGESLRRFFLTEANPLLLIDFGGYQVFETATVDTNILLLTKETYVGQTKACMLNKSLKSLTKMSDFVKQNINKSTFTFNSWVITNDVENVIKMKVEKAGIPLKEWAIQINYGIKTGFNEAFIINEDKRNELIAKSSKNAEIIRPILRGRDIQKYHFDENGLYLIYIPWHFPLHEDNSIKGVSSHAEELFQTNYPDIYNHLLLYKTQLKNRNKSETGIRYEWYALQRFGANYWREFSSPKIIYPNMTKYLPFVYDKGSFFINDKGFIITGQHLEYLTAFFNSNVFKFCFRNNFPELQGGTRELRKVFFENVPVMKISDTINEIFVGLLDKLETVRNADGDVFSIEAELQDNIYKLYNFTKEEISFITLYESSIK